VYSTGDLVHKGVDTGVTFGFLNQLFKILKKIQTDQLIFLWDSPVSFRKELLPGYKLKEPKTVYEQEVWSAIYTEFDVIQQEVLPYIGLFNNFEQRGYESDDLIAQYVLNKQNEKVYIATGDDDLLQLLDDDCFIYNVNKKRVFTQQDFIAEFKISPKQWPIVKQIAGCTSDKVPGVAGVGIKTAIKFIKNELKSSSKAYQSIMKKQALIDFNHQLVALPFKNTIDIHNQIKQNSFSMKHFLRVCRDYGFNSFRTEKRKEEIRNLFNPINSKGESYGKKESRSRNKTQAQKEIRGNKISSKGKNKRKERRA
jgi:5'-3' exonuclease